jgi:NTE family protein
MTAPIYALVCAGGGAHGAFQVGVLKYIHEHFCRDKASPFTIFAGTSCGSLNTSFCASRSYDAIDSRLELEQAWLDFDVPSWYGNLYASVARRTARRFFPRRSKRLWSVLDPQPLRDVTHANFDRGAFERALELGTTRAAAVCATEVRTGRLCWFLEGELATEWNVTSSLGRRARLDADHIAASCSIPFVFPPLEIDGLWWCDGGVANRNPLGLPALLGATRIMAIGADRPLPEDLPVPDAGFSPGFTDMATVVFDQAMRDFVTYQAEMFSVINDLILSRGAGSVAPPRRSAQPLDEKLQIDLDKFSGLEFELVWPSKRIRSSDVFKVETVHAAGGSRTNLQFQKDFARDLIDMGYEDARNHHDRLARFFDDDRPHTPTTHDQFLEMKTG